MATITASSVKVGFVGSVFTSRRANTVVIHRANAAPVNTGALKNCFNSTGRYTLGSKGMTVSTGIVQYWS